MFSALTVGEIDILIESLTYSKQRIQDYQDYPSPEFKQKRIEEVDALIAKLHIIKKEVKQ